MAGTATAFGCRPDRHPAVTPGSGRRTSVEVGGVLTDQAAADERTGIVVVVVTHAGVGDMLDRCLDALGRARGVERVIVVDNSGRADGLDERHRAFAEVLRTENSGFGAAANAGFHHAGVGSDGGPALIALLNDDVVVSADWAEPLVAALAGDDRLGGVQPKLLVADSDPVVINSAGVVLDPAGAGSDLGDGMVDAPVWQVPRRIVMFTGGAVVFRAAFLAEMGGFDERYFLYYEDVDLALRGGNRGWHFGFEPASTVWHARSSTTSQLGSAVRRLQERNRIWMVVRFGSATMIARALWLSIRRLRHQPRRLHARALLAGLAGAPRRLVERWRDGSARRLLAEPRSKRIERRGVNVVGYHHVSSGLGTAARAVHHSLLAAGVPTRAIDIAVTDSPAMRSPSAHDAAPEFDTSIFVVAAEALPGLIEQRPELRATADLVVGCFFWELASAPATHRYGIALVDEIWAATTFVAGAYDGCGRPVYTYPIRLEPPSVSADDVTSWRSALGATADTFVFLVSFDFFSSVDRKNPFAAIAAFTEAFADETSLDVRLVVKTINGASRPDDLQGLLAATDDPRVTVIDEHVEAERLDALIAAADCFVSLHRGEGLGLHLASAMWLGTPVIASRYSGNLDFMDDACAALIDVELVDVADRSGAYPHDATWAEPDHRQSVDWMRRLAHDPASGQEMAAAAVERMNAQPTAEHFGLQYWSGVHGPGG